jgi:hypothetical protein
MKLDRSPAAGAQFSRRLGCGACTKSPDTHPKRGRQTAPPPPGRSSVADLDAGPVPDPPIPIPNGGASGPVACWFGVDRSGRYIDGSWAGYRRSKQCTNCQTTNNASGYLTTPSSRSPGCTRQANTACDKQTDQKLSHFQPLRMSALSLCIYAKFMWELRRTAEKSQARSWRTRTAPMDLATGPSGRLKSSEGPHHPAFKGLLNRERVV